MLVSKADGTAEEFVPHKLVVSLTRSGSTPELAEHILQEVKKELYPGMSTGEIYTRAFAHLKRDRKGAAARYSLKRAVLEFGPSGFPFESYLAELFRAEGWHAEVDQIIQGACVDHEVDVVLTKGEELVYVEAKFHNTPGFKSDLKTALYVAARIEDIQKNGHVKATGLIVTNTKFTSKALQYATCKGLPLLGWDYPQHKTLHERIEQAGLYPVTALSTLNKREKMALLNERIVLCNDLSDKSGALKRVGVDGKKATDVLEEVGALCTPHKAL